MPICIDLYMIVSVFPPGGFQKDECTLLMTHRDSDHLQKHKTLRRLYEKTVIVGAFRTVFSIRGV